MHKQFIGLFLSWELFHSWNSYIYLLRCASIPQSNVKQFMNRSPLQFSIWSSSDVTKQCPVPLMLQEAFIV